MSGKYDNKRKQLGTNTVGKIQKWRHRIKFENLRCYGVGPRRPVRCVVIEGRRQRNGAGGGGGGEGQCDAVGRPTLGPLGQIESRESDSPVG